MRAKFWIFAGYLLLFLVILVGQPYWLQAAEQEWVTLYSGNKTERMTISKTLRFRVTYSFPRETVIRLTGGTPGLVVQSPNQSKTVYRLNPQVQITKQFTIEPQVQPQPASKLGPSPSPQPQTQPVPRPQLTPGLIVDEQRMVDLINQERVKNGLLPLRVNLELAEVARLKAKDMLENNYFSHNSPTYGSPFNMMKQFGISYRTAGENLAGAPTVEIAHQNLMNSSGHRANILNPSFTEVGVGVLSGGPYGKVFVEMFIGK